MDCTDARALVALAHDREIAPADAVLLDRHLAGCPGCAAHAAELSRLSAGLGALGRPALPPALPGRLRAALQAAPGARAVRASRLAWPAAVAAALLLGVLLGRALPPAAPEDGAAWRGQVTEAHLRALLPAEALALASSDQHAIRPWLGARLDFAPPFRDLAEAGFPLLGARLDHVAGRRVAVVQYARRAHRIALLTWPEAGADAAPASDRHQGFALLRWRAGGFTWVLVSDLNAVELAQLAGLLGTAAP